MTADGIDLINENDAGCIFFALHEQIANATGADADEHFDEVGTGNGEKGNAGFTGHGPGQQGFAGARGTNQKHTLGDLAAEFGEFLGILEEGDDLFKLFLGLLDAGHVLEGDFALSLGQEFCSALAERHGLAAPHLHLAHEEDPDSDQQEQREPGDKNREPGKLLLFRLGIDGDFFLEQLLGKERVGRLVGTEFLAVLAFKLAGYVIALNGYRRDFTGLDLRHEIAEVDLFSRRARLVEHVEQQDHHQADDQPEREIFVELVHGMAPVGW